MSKEARRALDWEVIFWVVLAALAFVGEIMTVSFFLLFFALGATVGVLLAFLGFGMGVQIVGFVAASLLSMAVLRPALLNRLAIGYGDNYDSPHNLTGKGGVVMKEIEPGESGTVKIGNGEFWTARSLYPDQRIEKGAKVRVLDTDGLTALVESTEVESFEGGDEL
jgi:membrane protein implicated in regulation of membrane protease activity